MRARTTLAGTAAAAVLALACAPAGHAAGTAPRAFDVAHYAARLEPGAGTVQGTVVVRAVAAVDGARVLELDRGALVIDAARLGSVALRTESPPGRVRVTLPAPVARGAAREIALVYHGAPRSGLEFPPGRAQLYTVFSTSQWMPCLEAPDARASFDLALLVPRGWTTVGNGVLVGRREAGGGRTEFTWRLARPAPAYTYGFAAGRFAEVAERRTGVTLRMLGPPGSEDTLRRVFRETGSMLQFFTEHAGVPYPDSAYTQVLVAETIGQEMTGFAVLPEGLVADVLADSSDVGLVAHELAHQWWGNGVTCRAWTHFWLSEGFAKFMASAWREHRWGRPAYLADMARARARWQAVRDAGHDRSLVFPDWDHPTADDRTLVYQKGAIVLHELREQLGEDAFWAGIRHWTRTRFGQPVDTAQFRAAMEESSGADLSEFFAEWVTLGPKR